MVYITCEITPEPRDRVDIRSNRSTVSQRTKRTAYELKGTREHVHGGLQFYRHGYEINFGTVHVNTGHMERSDDGGMLLLHQSPECPYILYNTSLHWERSLKILMASWIGRPASLGCGTPLRSQQDYLPL